MTVAYLFSALGPDGAPDASRAHEEHVRRQREDAALLTRLRDGDMAALEQLYHTYHAAMWDVAHRYMHDNDVAQDVVHDVFRMVWERRTSLTIESAIGTYLFGAVRHRALNLLRHSGVMRRAAETFDTDVPALGETPPSPDALTADADFEAHVLRYIGALPERTRALVMLRWKHGLTYAEIAVALGMSNDATKKLGQRVREILRPLLEDLQSR